MPQLQRVRLINDPTKLGFLTERTIERAGRTLYEIDFLGTQKRYVPEGQFEIILEGQENPLDLLEQGKVGQLKDLRRVLSNVRLGGNLTDLLYSMEITNTDFYAYQFKPVIKILNSPNNGLLIADEVGLGKTIEAGLIWTELRSRFDVRKLLVICPAMLREKWRDELSNRFGITADICDAKNLYDRLKQSRKEGSHSSFSIIASMQGLRPTRGWKDNKPNNRYSSKLAKLLEENENEHPLIDLLIIDEAHYLRNPETKTSQLGRLLRNVSEYIIMLSATPIHLNSDDLFQLMQLIDEDTFHHISSFNEIINANKPLIELRDLILSGNLTKDDYLNRLEQARKNYLLRENKQLPALIEYINKNNDINNTSNRIEIARRIENINLLSNVITRTRKRDVNEWRVIREPIAETIPMTQIEQQFYNTVTQTVRDFCSQYDYYEGFLLVSPQRQMASSMPAALKYWKEKSNQIEEQMYEDFGDDNEYDNTKIGPLIKQLTSNVEKFGNLDDLIKNDSKYKRLLEILLKYFNDYPNEKIIIFSYFRATLKYLTERLNCDKINSIMLIGGDNKENTIKSFKEDSNIRILLSSEVGSEGIDLQFCRTLINYDLPWNPMKIEQRIGRIDRLGQKADKISIWNLFYDDTIDSRIYIKLFNRLNIFQNVLGNIEPILGDKIRPLTYDLLRNNLTKEQEEQRINQTAIALENIRNEEIELENEAAHLVAHGDYILKQVKAVRELNRWITNQDIENYVIDYFDSNYNGCEFRKKDVSTDIYDINLSNEAKNDLESFIRTKRIAANTNLTRTNSIKCKFENKVVNTNNDRIEIINQVHPVIRFINDKINNNQELQQHPAVAIKCKHNPNMLIKEPGNFVFTIRKWKVSGLQEIEKLSFSVASVSDNPISYSPEDSEKIIMAILSNGDKNWYEAKNYKDFEKAADIANNICLAQSDKLYEDFVNELKMQNFDRAQIQLNTLKSHKENQIKKLTEIIERHRQNGREPLAKATEGKIVKLEDRVERKQLEVNNKKEIKHNQEDICIGILRIY
ncbi:MAG: DEAD/DEAH box helicase [Ignavibacteriales bacterium]|nr:DEAD/DEAH box helicase [Ignavibacteriales bacterium]